MDYSDTYVYILQHNYFSAKRQNEINIYYTILYNFVMAEQ